MTGIELIAQERQEQIEKHKISIYDDIDHNDNGELIESVRAIINQDFTEFPHNFTKEMGKKILNKPIIEQFAIAGALIAAEMDRLINKDKE